MLCLQGAREVDGTRRWREHANMSRHFVKVLPRLLSKVPSGEGPEAGSGRWGAPGQVRRLQEGAGDAPRHACSLGSLQRTKRR